MYLLKNKASALLFKFQLQILEFELTDQTGCIEFKEAELLMHCITFTFIHSADAFIQMHIKSYNATAVRGVSSY